LKLVKEHIFEKFEEKSDPVKDMGIGLEQEIKRWFKEQTSENYNREDALIFSCFEGKTKYVKYFIKLGIDLKINRNAPLRWAARRGHLEIVKMLLEAGAGSKSDIKDIIKILENYRFSEKEKIQSILEYLIKYYDRINEKFEETSDPIKDMGIGSIPSHFTPMYIMTKSYPGAKYPVGTIFGKSTKFPTAYALAALYKGKIYYDGYTEEKYFKPWIGKFFKKI